MYDYCKLAGSRNSAFSELRVSPDEEKRITIRKCNISYTDKGNF